MVEALDPSSSGTALDASGRRARAPVHLPLRRQSRLIHGAFANQSEPQPPHSASA